MLSTLLYRHAITQYLLEKSSLKDKVYKEEDGKKMITCKNNNNPDIWVISQQ